MPLSQLSLYGGGVELKGRFHFFYGDISMWVPDKDWFLIFFMKLKLIDGVHIDTCQISWLCERVVVQ